MSCLDLAPFDRRAFLGSLVLSVLAVPLATEAQQAGRVYLIGFLSPSSPSDSRNPLILGALRQGLRELGYVEGQNIGIESRWAEGKYDRLPDLAAELVRLKVDIIVTYAPPAIQAAKQATQTIPIVMGGVIDPVATGFVASLARPGGNLSWLGSNWRSSRRWFPRSPEWPCSGTLPTQAPHHNCDTRRM